MSEHIVTQVDRGSRISGPTLRRTTPADVQQWAKANGMALVPLEPTEAMLLAGNSRLPATINSDNIWCCITDMIKAAQEPTE